MEQSHETFGDIEVDPEKLQKEYSSIGNFRKLHSSNFITDTQISMQNQSIQEAMREERGDEMGPEISSKVIYNRISRPSNIQIIDKSDDQVVDEMVEPTANHAGGSKHATLERQEQP